MDLFIEAYVIVQKYFIKVRFYVSSFVITISDNLVKIGMSLSAIWKFKMADLTTHNKQ